MRDHFGKLFCRCFRQERQHLHPAFARACGIGLTITLEKFMEHGGDTPFAENERTCRGTMLLLQEIQIVTGIEKAFP